MKISVNNKGEGYIQVYLSSLIENFGEDYGYDDRVTYWYKNGVEEGVVYGDPVPYASEGAKFRFSGLSPGTQYTIKAEVFYYGSASTLQSVTATAKITTTKTSIERWDWEKTNSTINPSHSGEATAAETKKAFNACSEKKEVSNFSYKVWNDLVYKVYEARLASGSSNWDTTYGSFNNTLMTSSNKILTANRYNAVRNQHKKLNTVVPKVNTGDIVKGQNHFLTLVNALNDWIDTLNN